MIPTSEADLAEAIRSADQPLCIQGGGTRLSGLSGPIVETSGLSGISLYEPGALTLVVQAGTPVAQIEAALHAENQRLAFEPPDLRDVLGTKGQSTMGGIASANASGPRRLSAGACRDFMLGVKFIDGSGQSISNGGRVMKNVTGYDMVKLLSGAHGTLGVLTELSLKVLPNVEMQACLRLDGLDPAQAVTAMSAALGSPFEVSGAARDASGAVLLRLEGFEASVRYRAQQLQSKLTTYGVAELLDDQEICAHIWRDIRDARALSQGGDLWRISVKPSDAPALLDALDHPPSVMDWGGGLIWVVMPEGRDLRAKMTVPGHATLMRATSETFAALGRFHPEPAPLSKISAGLRATFDPRGILNSGLMGGAA